MVDLGLSMYSNTCSGESVPKFALRSKNILLHSFKLVAALWTIYFGIIIYLT